MGKKNRRQQMEAEENNWNRIDDDQEGQTISSKYIMNNNKKCKKNKKKNKKNKQKSKVDEAAQLAAKLSALKEQRQNELVKYGNSLLENLEVKYAPHLTDDINELWEGQILDAVSFYDDDYEDKVENMSLLKEKKEELREQWAEIFELIEEDYNECQAEREEKQKERDREAKLAALRAQGLNIGNNTARPSAASQKAAKKEGIEGEDEEIEGAFGGARSIAFVAGA